MFELAACAYLIDWCFGELPGTHPVELMGRYISCFEQRFYRNSLLPGCLLVLSLILITLAVSMALISVMHFLPDGLSLLLLSVFASMGLAMNMLHNSVRAVMTAKQPRQTLQYLVSRDTENMTDTEVYKAAIETWAENLSDGVIAPLFFLVLFGIPGLAVYKAINTLDSMVAYKTERYFYFGKCAAIVDDIANWIPSRLTAVLIVLLAPHKHRAWQCLWRDGHKLDSPNAGYPIAAMAGALGVSLGGNALYHGQLKVKAVLGEAIHPVTKTTLEHALAFKTRFDLFIFCLLVTGIFLHF